MEIPACGYRLVGPSYLDFKKTTKTCPSSSSNVLISLLGSWFPRTRVWYIFGHPTFPDITMCESTPRIKKILVETASENDGFYSGDGVGITCKIQEKCIDLNFRGASELNS